ncbi:GFA family protein [Thalassotalea euphylliae]|uniref:GFA family protein n=1 Tax=Thalassotalea euphylliae TaxID=1655234 RepID=UPI003636C15D
MKYKGQCHCGDIQFEFEDSNLEALQCNCSICIRKNAIMSKSTYSPEQFSLLSGKQNLSTYRWGDKDVNHYFCRSCGIYPFHDTTYEPGTFRVNLGCVENIDSRSLTTLQFDGKNAL